MRNLFNKCRLVAVLICTMFLILNGCAKLAPKAPADYPSSTNENTSEITTQPPTEEPASTSGNPFPAFETKDLKGNTVDNSVFEANKLTMINIWGTFCPPCIDEMPELGKMANAYKDSGVQILGIVSDAIDPATIDQAVRILQAAKADFLNVVPDDSINEFLRQFQYVPSTVFVDADGNIVGDTVVGADLDAYKKQIDSLLEKQK